MTCAAAVTALDLRRWVSSADSAPEEPTARRALVFGLSQFSLGACLIERRLQVGDLRLEHRIVQMRQHLALLHVIAGLDIHRGNAPAVAFDANGHVVARGNGADDADGGGHAC